MWNVVEQWLLTMIQDNPTQTAQLLQVSLRFLLHDW